MKIRSAGWITALVLGGLMAFGVISLLNMKSEVDEAVRTETQLQSRIEELQEENAALQFAIENQDDPDTYEDIARDKLGLVMPDERIFYDTGE